MEFRKILPNELLASDMADAVCFELPMKEGSIEEPGEYYKKRVSGRAEARERGDVDFMERYAAVEGGVLMSAVSAIPYRMWFDGQFVPMVGIGSVLTLPPYRRRGLVKELMRVVLEEAYEKEQQFSYLYPFSQRYYEKFGYALSEPRARYTIDLTCLDGAPTPEGQFELYDGTFDIDPYMTAFAGMRGFNTMVERERYDFRLLYGANPHTTRTYAYLYRDKDNWPKGYIIFTKNQENGGRVLMDVSELVFDGYETLRSIMAFAAGFAADYSAIRFWVPDTLPLERLCRDYPRARAERDLQVNGMVRVVNPRSVLKSAQYNGSGECVLEIRDGFLGKTHHLYVAFKQGKATVVDETRLKPDCVLDIGTFSQAITGRYSTDDMEYMGLIKLILSDISRVFYKKKIFTNTYF